MVKGTSSESLLMGLVPVNIFCNKITAWAFSKPRLRLRAPFDVGHTVQNVHCSKIDDGAQAGILGKSVPNGGDNPSISRGR